jgi:hypothetical protein
MLLAAEQRDELAPLDHSITSSAVCRNEVREIRGLLRAIGPGPNDAFWRCLMWRGIVELSFPQRV